MAWRQSSRPGNDALFLNGLRREAKRYGRYVKGQRAWTLLADTGFDGRGVQANDVIPPMRRHGKITDPERRAQADWVSAARLEGLFGQRWKTETVHSVIKRKFGGAVRSRKYWHQYREPAIKALVYNLHR